MEYYMPRLLTRISLMDYLIFLLTSTFLIAGSASFGQSVSAQDEARLGITLVDDQEFSEGIKHLRKARNLDLTEYEYPFEIGRAFLLWGKAKKAEQYFYPLIEHADATPELFVLLADCYRDLGKSKNEKTSLEVGLGKFPSSGMVFSRMGEMFAANSDGPMALAYWEKGIEMDPTFPDNYRHAAQFLSSQHDQLWTWLYGQTYLNLTVANDHPDVNAMQFVRKSMFRLFNKGKNQPDKKGLDAKVYEVLIPCSMNGIVANKIIEIEPKMACFIEAWQKLEGGPSIPVFDHLNLIASMGKMTEYLFWLYGEADRTEMNEWGTDNAQNFNEFATWVYWNGIQLDAENPFNRLRN